MARQRGGGGNKRQATTPVGASFKDPRREARAASQQAARFDNMGDYDTSDGEWTEVNHGRNNQYNNSSKVTNTIQGQDPSQQQQHQQQQNQAPTHQREDGDPQTFASVVSQSGGGLGGHRESQDVRHGEKEKKTLARMFKTAPPDGPNRDNIVIEIRQVNGEPFKGSLHYKEAKFGIWKDCLGMDPTLIHGLTFAFSDYPIIKYKLKNQINIDGLRNVEFFEFNRAYKVNGMNRNDVLSCKIKGIRSNYSEETSPTETDPDVRWVKIEWCDYAFEEHEILVWLEQFGQPIGHITEEIYPDSDSDGDPTGNGTFTVKMKLHTPIPQLLPMWGKRIRIYYRGIQKLCPRCFGNHPRKNCRSEKRKWLEYVLDFMEHHSQIPEELYGRWYDLVNQEYGEIIQDKESNVQDNPEQLSTQEETREETQTEQSQDSGQSQNQSSQSRPIQLKPAFISRPRTNQTKSQYSNQSGSHQTRPNHQRDRMRLSKEDEENLSEYLGLGMSIDEARSAFQKEIEMAELRAKIRENQRNRTRGEIGTSSRTQVGNATSHRGSGRGGLSFN